MLGLCVEASHARGMGHFFRALNFAKALRSAGRPVLFLMNGNDACQQRLRTSGYPYELVDLADLEGGWESEVINRRGIELWVNDRLDTDARHASRVKEAGIPLVTFDDRGSGASAADLNVAAMALDERESLPGGRVIRGVEYLVLNPEIAAFRRVRTGKAHSVVVTLGGSDTWGVTPRVVSALRDARIPATVILGPGFQHERELSAELTDRFAIKKDVPSLIAEFANHDIAITAGGITPFEANASGLPCVVIACEEFEKPVAASLQAFGSAVYAGYRQEFDPSLLKMDLPLEDMSRAGIAHIDLEGAARILEEIEAIR